MKDLRSQVLKYYLESKEKEGQALVKSVLEGFKERLEQYMCEGHYQRTVVFTYGVGDPAYLSTAFEEIKNAVLNDMGFKSAFVHYFSEERNSPGYIKISLDLEKEISTT